MTIAHVLAGEIRSKVGDGDPIVFGPKSSDFSKSLIQNRLLTHCCLSSKETLRGVAYCVIDCLTEFSARKIPENSGFSAAIVFVKKTLVFVEKDVLPGSQIPSHAGNSALASIRIIH